jgi:hypothetical protein
VLTSSAAFSADGSGSLHEGHSSSSAAPPQNTLPLCVHEGGAFSLGLEGVQIETSDIALYEQFFDILKAPVIEQHEHPGRDRLKGYCYRGVSIVVRQDLQQPRPTGWVQINFSVQDAAAIQQELERFYKESPVAKLEEPERNNIIRFRLKPDVKRGDRKAVRLEVFGPDGFMIGLNQYN